MRVIFHDFFRAIRLHKYFFDLTAVSKCRRHKILFQKILYRTQNLALFFMIFSVQNDSTDIFSIWRRDKSAAIAKFKFKNSWFSSKWGLFFMIFQNETISHIFFRFFDKIKVSPSQNLKSKNFKRLENEVYLSWFFWIFLLDYKMGLFLIIFKGPYDNTNIFLFRGKIKVPSTRNFNSKNS